MLPQIANKLVHKFMIYVQIWNLFKVWQNYEKIEKSLPLLLEEKGLVIKEVEPDGNCMFRAISDQLYGTEVFHFELRKYAL
jgi:OTU domain-containing protein 5